MASGTEDLVITRIFNAPRARVWEAWTRPETVKRWWGPRAFTSPSCEIDLRVGGKYLFCMRADTGPESWRKGIWSTGVYREIAPPERLVFTDSFADEKGNVVPAAHYGMEDFPEALLISLMFEDAGGGKTKMTLRHAGLPENMESECRTGWNESLDKLADVLAKGERSQAMEERADPMPREYHSITPSLVVRGAREAIEFYKKVFGARVTFIQDRSDGKVMHAEIKIGDSIVMLADECPPHDGHDTKCVRSPAAVGGTTVNLYLYVPDADVIFNLAVKNKAAVSMPMADMFWGDRVGMFRDPFGHFWSVATHKEDVGPEELKERMAAFFSKEKAAR